MSEEREERRMGGGERAREKEKESPEEGERDIGMMEGKEYWIEGENRGAMEDVSVRTDSQLLLLWAIILSAHLADKSVAIGHCMLPSPTPALPHCPLTLLPRARVHACAHDLQRMMRQRTATLLR